MGRCDRTAAAASGPPDRAGGRSRLGAEHGTLNRGTQARKGDECASVYEARRGVTHDVVVAIAVLGVAGQALCVCLAAAALARLAGWHAPLDAIRGLVWGYELWLGFVVAAVATC